MTMRRMVVMAGGAIAPIALLALLFNNQWVVDAIRRSGFNYADGLGPVVQTFHFTSWRLTASGPGWRTLLAQDIGLLVFLALLAALVFAAARAIEPRQGVLGAVVTGWWAAAVAGGVAGLVRGALIVWAIDVPGVVASRTVWTSVHGGATFGFMYGWIAGLGVLGAFLLTRQREAVQQPYGAQQQYGVQQQYGTQQPYGGQRQQPHGQPYGGQQPYGTPQPGAQVPQQRMPQQGMPQQGMPQQGMPQHGVPQQAGPPHPSAVPYVPPQGVPQQQPQWGGVPQQPGAPQQFGAPPAQPQQPVQPAQQAEPAPQAESSPPAPEEAKPSEPESAAAEDAAAAGESAGNEAAESGETAAADAPGSASEDDDLKLGDRTVVDRERDDE